MDMELSEQELQQVVKLMDNSNKLNLANNVKSANELITKALQDSDISSAKVAKFVKSNMYAPASHDIQEEEDNHTLNDNDVKRWIGTIDFVASRAKKLCNKSAKEAKTFNLN